MKRLFVGFDLGSISLDVAVTDEEGALLWSSYQRVHGRSREAVALLCRDLLEKLVGPQGIDSFDGAMAAGSGKEIVAEALGVPTVNEIVAHGTAAARIAHGKASVIEIGGQDSKFILVDEHGPYDYAMNELCAAGTGAFLDVQAERLGLSIEELSRLAASAAHVPPVAGRCSVFAKSDIIHLQQRGTPVDEIVAGLCHALARNFIATLVRGREILRPVVFQGGVALNDGVIRAFRELLKLETGEMIRPEHPHLMGAIGAALISREAGKPLTRGQIEAAAALPVAQGSRSVSLAGWKLDQASERQRCSLEEYRVEPGVPDSEPLYLGIDVGSVSTDAILATGAGSVAAHVYTFTAGKPLEAVSRALAFLGKHFDASRVAAVGATGSGRKLCGHFVGADSVIDEITAQARGARAAFPDADTVIEIGGQDAKLIRLDAGGLVRDFEMNRACSAGTGSFIQEQAARLDVDLRADFARLALEAPQPVALASRCTVFMESDLVHHVQQGAPLPALLRAISEAVVDNYLDRVARGLKPGARIAMQGGVARNAAVVEAFRRRLAPSELVVHPAPGLSGAIGAALLAADAARRPGLESAFRGFSVETAHKPSVLRCRLCENQCEVNAFETAAGRFYFGDLCGRYAETLAEGKAGIDHTEIKETMLRALVRSTQGEESIGVPEALLFRELFPFWYAFFGALGIKLVSSGPSSSNKLNAGLARLPAETCLPVKLLFGHVAELAAGGQRRILIPEIDRYGEGIVCPYVQHAAAMIRSVFPKLEILTWPLVPGLSDGEREALCERLANALHRRENDVEAAYREAEESLRLALRAMSIKVDRNRPVAVILGKPYNSGDRFVNLALTSKLARAGFDVAFADQLPDLSVGALPQPYDSITWSFSRGMLRAAVAMRGRENLFPVIVGNFGCGPDSFTLPLIEQELGDRPSLFLELDEHRADAGLETRVEAFSQRAFRWLERVRAGEAPESRPPRQLPRSQAPVPRNVFIVPRFSDHAFAFAGALRAAGATATVLPPPGREVAEAAIELSGGKQCHPFQMIAGDVVLLARRGELPQNATYFFPVSDGSCLITQYVPTMQRYLDSISRGDVRVTGGSSAEMTERFGAGFMISLGRGIAAVEYLMRLRCELRPYETTPGAIDAAYAKALEIFTSKQAAGDAEEGLVEAVWALEQVETRDRGSRPVVGIAGDVYTRVNPEANGHLFELLEELGCEVWPAPTLIDMALSRGEQIPGRLPLHRELWSSTISWAANALKSMELWQVQRHFKGLLRNLLEPDDEEIVRSTKPYLTAHADQLLRLNVAKHLDFARKNVDGILNVFCLNCMVGTATAAIHPALKEQVGEVPLMSLVFDGLGTTHARNRIEAFVHRVKRAREERRERESVA